MFTPVVQFLHRPRTRLLLQRPVTTQVHHQEKERITQLAYRRLSAIVAEVSRMTRSALRCSFSVPRSFLMAVPYGDQSTPDLSARIWQRGFTKGRPHKESCDGANPSPAKTKVPRVYRKVNTLSTVQVTILFGFSLVGEIGCHLSEGKVRKVRKQYAVGRLGLAMKVHLGISQRPYVQARP